MNPSWAPDSTQVVFVCYRRQRVETRFNYQYLGPYDGLDGYKLKEICVSDLDGDNRRQLTDDLEVDSDPSWSPDGTQIAFVSTRDTTEGADIYVLQSDGTNLVNLTHHAAGYRQLRWSPDGHTIAFIATQDNLNGDLYTMPADGSQVVRLTEMGGVSNFDWSPDGKSIIFDSGVASTQEIFVVNVENGSIAQVTNNQSFDFEPVWSPNGHHIAFSSEREDGVQVYLMDIQTHEETRISECLDPSWGASYSPDGQFLAYISGSRVGPKQTLHILDLDTETSTTFSDIQVLDRPSWSPNSQYLIYERTDDWNEDGFGETKLWVIQVDDGTKWAVSSTTEMD